MDAVYAGSTVCQTYIAMGTMFRSAARNRIILEHPTDGVRHTTPARAVDDIKFLTGHLLSEKRLRTSTIKATGEPVHQKQQPVTEPFLLPIMHTKF